MRALNVNTVDEVPDSSWFTNRIGRATMPIAEVVRGPDRLDRRSRSTAGSSSGGKCTGVQPGFRMTDPAGQLYQIEVDPPSNPELATGAEIIGTAFYHAFGYHTVEVYLAELDPATPGDLASRRRSRDPLNGRRRALTRRDVDDVLRRGARLPNGTLPRAGQPLRRRQAARQLPLLRHAARRSQRHRAARASPRAARRARLRRLAEPRRLARHQQPRHARDRRTARRYVKHYMFDFGSILGSGTVYAQRHRAGNEYIFEWRPGWLTLATLGLYMRPWMHIDYPRRAASRSAGSRRDAFDPLKWKPEYPNPAFDNMRAGRCVLGGADRRAVRRRDDPRRRREGALHRSARDRLHDRDADRAARQGAARLADRRQPARRLRARAMRGELTFANAADRGGRGDAGARAIACSGPASTTPPALCETRSRPRCPVRARRAPAQLLTAAEFLQLEASAEHPRRPEWQAAGHRALPACRQRLDARGGSAASPVTNLRVEKPTPSNSEMSRSFPPELMAEASWRLGWLGLIYAVAGAVEQFGRRALLALTGSLDPGPRVQDAFMVAAVAMGIAVFVVSRRGLLSPKRLLDLGLVFQVAGAFGIAIREFWDGRSADRSAARPRSFRPNACGLSRFRSSCRTRRGRCSCRRCWRRPPGRWRWRSRRRSRAGQSTIPLAVATFFLATNYLCAVSAYAVARDRSPLRDPAEAGPRDRQLRAGRAHRRRRHGGSLAGEAPAAGAPRRDQADPHRRARRRASERARRSSAASSARRRTRRRSAPPTRSTSTTSASPKRATSTT